MSEENKESRKYGDKFGILDTLKGNPQSEMSEEKHILAGIDEHLRIKAQVNESLCFVNQLINQAEHPEMLKYVRNRLKEPYILIQRKLNSMGIYDDSQNLPKLVANSAKKK